MCASIPVADKKENGIKNEQKKKKVKNQKKKHYKKTCIHEITLLPISISFSSFLVFVRRFYSTTTNACHGETKGIPKTCHTKKKKKNAS